MVAPHLLQKLTHYRYELSADLPELTRIIKMDPALCFEAMRLDRCMKLADQTEGSFRIDATVGRIGLPGVDAILSRVLAEQVLDSAHHQRGQALQWLWRHTLTTALLAQALAKAMHGSAGEEAYTAGLLHGIGKLALLARTPAACAPMLTDPTQAVSLLEAEEQVAGWGQDRIGAYLIRRFTHAWSAADAAAFHTASETQIRQALPLVQIIWAASHLAVEPWPASPAHQTVAAVLNIDRSELERISQTAEERVRTMVAELGPAPDTSMSHRTAADDPEPLIETTQTRTVLAHVYEALLQAKDHVAVMRILRQSLSVFLGIQALMIFDHASREGCLVARWSAGIAAPNGIERIRIPLNASDCLPAGSHARDTMMDSFSPDQQNQLTIIDRQLLAAMGTDGFVCLPLRSGAGRGCLIAGIDGPDWPWSPQKKSLLAAVAAASEEAFFRLASHTEREIGKTIDQEEMIALRTRKIVHEINNPLSVIKNYLSVLARRANQQQPVDEDIRIINEEINRVGTLVRSLTAPPDKMAKDRKIIDVNATIKDILNLFKDGLPKDAAIHFEQDLDPSIPEVEIDRNLLKQAVVNLLKNATEAIPGGGTITVRTSMLLSMPSHKDHRSELEYIKISVCDNGPGIDEGLRNSLFKPHATSKAGHEGLGLAIVKEAMTHLNGNLQCESGPGRGTCFHLEIPAAKYETY